MIHSPKSLISKTYKHVNRYAEIVSVLIKFGFSDIVSKIHIHRYIGKRAKVKKKIEEKPDLNTWQRIKFAVEELGPTFVKFGQIISNRPDLLPAELIKELESLQDNVEQFEWDKAKQIIEGELNCPIEKIFCSFSEKPIASASIAQVYTAVTQNGERVAVKVQRPGIEDKIKTDIEIMYHLAGLLEKHYEPSKLANPVSIVREFEKSILKELDFSHELSNLKRFRKNFASDKKIGAPKSFDEISTSKILVMEQIAGIKISETNKLIEMNYDLQKIASLGAESFFKQIFQHGFFHADPHPGNIVVTGKNSICFLDFGMTGCILPSQKAFLTNLVLGIAARDAKKIAKTVLLFSEVKNRNLIEKMEIEIETLMEEYLNVPLKEIPISTLFEKLFRICYKFKINIPANFFLLSKSFILIESIARKLQPDFDTASSASTYAQKLIIKKFSPKKISHESYLLMEEMLLFLKDTPSAIRDVLEMTRDGNLKIEFEHHRLGAIKNALSKTGSIVSSAIIIASLIIGSSLIVLSGIPPKFNNIPVIGIIGYISAAIIGIGYLFVLFKEN